MKYCLPPHLLDVASIIYELWDATSSESILNCFIKAKMWSFDQRREIEGWSQKKGIYKAPVPVDIVNEICESLKSLHLPLADEEAIETNILLSPALTEEKRKEIVAIWLNVEDDPWVQDEERLLVADQALKETRMNVEDQGEAEEVDVEMTDLTEFEFGKGVDMIQRSITYFRHAKNYEKVVDYLSRAAREAIREHHRVRKKQVTLHDLLSAPLVHR